MEGREGKRNATYPTGNYGPLPMFRLDFIALPARAPFRRLNRAAQFRFADPNFDTLDHGAIDTILIERSLFITYASLPRIQVYHPLPPRDLISGQ